jgi:hypothetical protein
MDRPKRLVNAAKYCAFFSYVLLMLGLMALVAPFAAGKASAGTAFLGVLLTSLSYLCHTEYIHIICQAAKETLCDYLECRFNKLTAEVRQTKQAGVPHA